MAETTTNRLSEFAADVRRVLALTSQRKSPPLPQPINMEAMALP